MDVPGSYKWGDQMEFLRTQHHLEQREEFMNIEGFSPPADSEVKAVAPQPRPVKSGEVSFHHSLTWARLAFQINRIDHGELSRFTT